MVVVGVVADYPPTDFGMTMMASFQKSLSFATFSTDTVPKTRSTCRTTEQFEAASRGELQMVVHELLPFRASRPGAPEDGCRRGVRQDRVRALWKLVVCQPGGAQALITLKRYRLLPIVLYYWSMTISELQEVDDEDAWVTLASDIYTRIPNSAISFARPRAFQVPEST
jgi:hypothetical protein